MSSRANVIKLFSSSAPTVRQSKLECLSFVSFSAVAQRQNEVPGSLPSPGKLIKYLFRQVPNISVTNTTFLSFETSKLWA